MRKLVLLAVLILSVGVVAAHGDYYEDDYVFKEKISETKYYPRENRVVTTTTYIDYDNEKRFPTYDYRHGYSYRATREYRDSYKVKSYSKSYSREYYENDYYYDYYNKDYYYDYIPRLGAYKKKTCYHEAPKGKLFYFKCPN